MSTTIHQESELTLIDGTKIKVRPLKISLLRPFMKSFEKIQDVADDNDKSMTLLLECVQIAMQQYAPDLAKDSAALEEIMDLPTVYKIIEAASGTEFAGSSPISL